MKNYYISDKAFISNAQKIDTNEKNIPTTQSNDNALIKYDTKLLSPTQRVKFYYAFKGRAGQKGVLEHYSGTFLAKGVILVSAAHLKNILDFFSSWNITCTVYIITIKEKTSVNNR